MRRTAVLLSALALGLTGCVDREAAAPEPSTSHTESPSSSETPSASGTPSQTPTASGTPAPTAKPTAGLSINGGWEYDSCVDQPGRVMMQFPFTIGSPTHLEDVGVYPGDLPVQNAWVAPTSPSAPDLVASVGYPAGFGPEVQQQYGWADRQPAADAELAPGRYHLLVLVTLDAGRSFDGADIVWNEVEPGGAHGTTKLDARTTTGDCEH